MRLAAALALALAACAPAGGMRTARALDSGTQQFIVGPELSGAGPANAAVPAPEIGAGYRRGVGSGIELEAKLASLPAGEALTTFGAELAAKVELYRGSRLEIAAATGAGYRLIHSSGASWEGIYLQAPLLFGINLRGGRDQLVVGPRIGIQRWYSSGAMAVSVPFAGSSIGYAWRVNRKLTIFPEIAVMRSPTELAERSRSTLLHGGIGFLFGH